jgi:hypothetical protein
LNVSLYNQKASNVSKGFIVRRHLTQMVSPDVSFQGSAGERFAGYRDDLAIFIPPRVGRCRDDKTDLRTLLPERPGKLVGKEERVIPPPLRQRFDSVVKTRPGGIDRRLKPFTKLETIYARLTNDDAKQFRPGHSFSRLRSWSKYTFSNLFIRQESRLLLQV